MHHSVRNISHISSECDDNNIPLAAPEDCASRKLIKDDVAESVKDVNEESAITPDAAEKQDAEDESGEDMGDEEWRKAMRIDSDDSDDSDESDTVTAEKVVPAISQYELDKAKNIAQLKERLEEVKKAYPMPEVIKKPAKPKSKSKKEKEPVERRVSTRNR